MLLVLKELQNNFKLLQGCNSLFSSAPLLAVFLRKLEKSLNSESKDGLKNPNNPTVADNKKPTEDSTNEDKHIEEDIVIYYLEKLGVITGHTASI